MWYGVQVISSIFNECILLGRVNVAFQAQYFDQQWVCACCVAVAWFVGRTLWFSRYIKPEIGWIVKVPVGPAIHNTSYYCSTPPIARNLTLSMVAPYTILHQVLTLELYADGVILADGWLYSLFLKMNNPSFLTKSLGFDCCRTLPAKKTMTVCKFIAVASLVCMCGQVGNEAVRWGL